MKKILAVVLCVVSLNALAFFNNNNYNTPWGYKDNGFFAYNPYEFTDPQWYSTEMENFFDEFGGNNYGNNRYGNRYNPYYNPQHRGYMPNPYMNAPQGMPNPYMPPMNNPYNALKLQ